MIPHKTYDMDDHWLHDPTIRDINGNTVMMLFVLNGRWPG